MRHPGLLLVLGTVLSPLPAMAADAIAPAPAAVSSTSVDWNGFYAGIYTGISHWETDDSDNTDPVTLSSTPVGIILGNNWAMGDIVVGIEGDLGLSGLNADLASSYDAGFWDNLTSSWIGHVRARVGVSMGKALVFAAAGLAAADFAYSLDYGGGLGPDETKASTLTGVSFGAGVDYAATDVIRLRAEVVFDDFGALTETFRDPETLTKTIGIQTASLRLGLIGQFN